MPTGPNGEKRPADPMSLAKVVMDIATGEAERGRNAAAARWGSR